jgi:hypothetical protein
MKEGRKMMKDEGREEGRGRKGDQGRRKMHK